MKPNWKDAPAWAEYVAQDGNGIWYWLEVKPQWLSNQSAKNFETRPQ